MLKAMALARVQDPPTVPTDLMPDPMLYTY